MTSGFEHFTEVEIHLNPEDVNDADKVEAGVKAKAGKSFIPGSTLYLRKRSVDARKKQPFYVLKYLIVPPGATFSEIPFTLNQNNVSGAREVHIIGAGPSGLFAALELINLGFKPVIFERGKDVRARRFDLAAITKRGEVNPDSNYCFGEGGAGTYSDGKLYTRSDKRGDIKRILAILTQFGAPKDILIDAHPHIGTNKLPGVIAEIRNFILACGGEIHFNSRITDFTIEGKKIKSLTLFGGSTVPVQTLILATGHSARDIFELLYNKGIPIEAKPFALGLRIEHPQEIIDQIRYHAAKRHPALPPAAYSLVTQVNGKGVFSFCMCPGGFIVPASTASDEIVVNGMSPSKRNSPFANSGMVVSVDHHDFRPFEQFGELKGMHYQAGQEKKAWSTVSEGQKAPAQRVMDFIQGKVSTNLPHSSYIPGLASTDLGEVLYPEIGSRIKEALTIFGNKIKNYLTNEAILVGVESRTSSPVKIPRDKNTLQHISITNLYPCGEGAGFAGGIVSAAIDGMNIAVKIALE